MFVRKKRNRSGSVSVQIIDKTYGYRVVQTVGCSSHPDEIARLWQKGCQLVKQPVKGQQQLFPIKTEADLVVENFVKELGNLNIRTIGPELIFGHVFDSIGFGVIDDELFRHLVVARLAYPTSKLKTVDYLYRYQGTAISVQTVYRFLDKLHHRYQKAVEQIAFNYTKKTLKGKISVVFYDMTTLYFEAESEDDLRKVGFSKDGKFQKPQIMLGLLVGRRGLPIGYDIFKGNTYEGHTLIPILKSMQKKYDLDKPVVIADAGLLSKVNLRALKEAGYQFVLGGKIKSESDQVKSLVLNKAEGLKQGDGFSFRKSDGTRLLVTYSDKRAKKDRKNRERGLRKLKERVKNGRLTKKNINNRGYNKFLRLEGEIAVTIDEEKILADQRWDGLKGYITNSRLGIRSVTENYAQLWQIEKAFRISKTDLRIRPIYHHLHHRIEAHICIAFVAYTIYKEIEIQLNRRGIKMSPKRAGELTQNMYLLEYSLPSTLERQQKILRMDEEQQALYNTIHKR